jgi:hypothetical protein
MRLLTFAMKKSLLTMFPLLAALAGCSTTGSHTESLFNGRDLSG